MSPRGFRWLLSATTISICQCVIWSTASDWLVTRHKMSMTLRNAECFAITGENCTGRYSSASEPQLVEARGGLPTCVLGQQHSQHAAQCFGPRAATTTRCPAVVRSSAELRLKTEDGAALLPREVNLLRELRVVTTTCVMGSCVTDGSCAVLTNYGPGGHPINEHIGAQGTGHGSGDDCDPRPQRSSAWCVQGGFNGVRQCGAASSSTVGWGGEPGFAVDGNVDGSFDAGSCSHTDNPTGSAAWWQVDLGSPASVERVTIHHRTDCCQGRMVGAVVLVGHSAQDVDDAEQCGMLRDDRSVPVEEVQCASAITGRFVRIMNTVSDGPIVLCEVEVWGHVASVAVASDILPCRSDVNRDRNVDVSDLLLVLAAFGRRNACGVEDTSSDDCLINVNDVLAVLSDFGRARC